MKDGIQVDRVIYFLLSNVLTHANPRHLPISPGVTVRSVPRLYRHAQRDTGRLVTKKSGDGRDYTNNHNILICGQRRSQSDTLPDGMGRLESRNDTLELGQHSESPEGLFVSCGDIF